MANRMNPKTFFGELKRRNVYKVAVAYAVASWLLIQIATQVFPFFEIPNWAVRLVVLLLVLGFPVALILSWAFEITPEGIKRESEIAPEKSMTRTTGRRIVGLTVVVAILAAGLFAFQLLRSKNTVAPRQTVIAARNEAATGQEIAAKSIAVLPFDNLSDDKANAYFAEGIQDEILTRLSKIAALKVISRSSTQKYKSAPDNLREVGKQLGVANLLEGSVQKIANAVHVNVQLIRAATDEHLWAESYNRKLDDVFGVEGEVASAIADQLNAKLSGSEQKAVTDKPTQNATAYDAYLRGLSIEHDQYGYEGYQRAAEAYAQAVQLDPKFALAWARLAVLRSFLYFNSVNRNVNTPAAVKDAADSAMALASEAGESWIAKGAYHYRVLRDFEGAVAAYKEAQRRLPNNSFVLQNLGFVQRRVGRWQEAEINFHKALELDPRDISLLSALGGEFYLYLRRFDDARGLLERALEIAPDSETAHAINASILQNEDRLAEAAQQLGRVPQNSTEDYVVSSRITQAMYERDFGGAIRLIEQKLNSVPPGQPLDSITETALVQLGFCQEWSGQHGEAQQSFTRAVESIKPTPDTVAVPDANGVPSTLALAYAGLGEKDKALVQAQRAVKDYDNDAVNKPQAQAVLAQIQARFGDQDAAIAALPHLLEVPAGLTIADLKFNPMWDPLRKDPRFQKLIAEDDSAKAKL
jgi:TolB-like protein/Tfp pilus assembly protein PilF